MDKREFKRVLDQVKPTAEQEQAMLDMLLRGGSFVAFENLDSIRAWLINQA